MHSLEAFMAKIYSALLIDNTATFCNVEHHEVALLPTVNAYQLVDLCVSTLPPI